MTTREREGGKTMRAGLWYAPRNYSDLTGRYEGLVTFWFESLNELE